MNKFCLTSNSIMSYSRTLPFNIEIAKVKVVLLSLT